jgi:hypothetical protein
MYSKAKLQDTQDHVYSLIRESLGELFEGAKLCGGTPLARCYLQHRISYDLDFFMPPSAGTIGDILKKLNAGCTGFTVDGYQDKTEACSSLFGHIYVNPDIRIEVCFIEDRWYRTYPKITAMMGDINIITEPVEGLYHRKLRTVAGYGSDEHPLGGRQTFRDIFDLYVLSRTIKPIPEFLQELPEFFPEDAFYNGLASMHWIGMADRNILLDIAPQRRWRMSANLLGV